MNIRKAVVSVVLCLVGFPMMAQSRYVFDAKGKPVGQLIGDETRPALIRYVLPTGDTVLLEAFPYGLRQGGPPTSPVFFLTNATCSGSIAYIDANSSQLTKRQATTVNFWSSPVTLTSSMLYVSAPFPSGILMPINSTAASKYANGVCTTNAAVGGFFLIQVNQSQNLLTTFVTPFWTP